MCMIVSLECAYRAVPAGVARQIEAIEMRVTRRENIFVNEKACERCRIGVCSV
jgi:hypothetical protein